MIDIKSYIKVQNQEEQIPIGEPIETVEVAGYSHQISRDFFVSVAFEAALAFAIVFSGVRYYQARNFPPIFFIALVALFAAVFFLQPRVENVQIPVKVSFYKEYMVASFGIQGMHGSEKLFVFILPYVDTKSYEVNQSGLHITGKIGGLAIKANRRTVGDIREADTLNLKTAAQIARMVNRCKQALFHELQFYMPEKNAWEIRDKIAMYKSAEAKKNTEQ